MYNYLSCVKTHTGVFFYFSSFFLNFMFIAYIFAIAYIAFNLLGRCAVVAAWSRYYRFITQMRRSPCWMEVGKNNGEIRTKYVWVWRWWWGV